MATLEIPTAPRGVVTLLPDPEPRALWCPIVSPDDHILEPRGLFEDRVPRSLRDRVPRIEDDDQGVPYWVWEDVRLPIAVNNGTVGRPTSEWTGAPTRFDEFRAGVWDVDARVRDMDLNGIWASLNFPSTTWGFVGKRFATMRDTEAGLAALRAWNRWMIDEWCGAYPDRFVPCQLTWLADPELAAEEIRRNAAVGFKAVSFSENPEALGFQSLYSGAWDPFFAACEETGTSVCLHVGSSGTVTRPSSDSPTVVSIALFPLNGVIAAIDWIYSKVPLRFPDLAIVLSEAGVSWVPMAIERLRRAYRRLDVDDAWSVDDPSPEAVLRRNFWFTSIEDPTAFHLLADIGEDRVMVESDYPHPDSSWPDTQEYARAQLEGVVSEEVVRKVCYRNACGLFRHPEPPDALLATSAIGPEVTPGTAT